MFDNNNTLTIMTVNHFMANGFDSELNSINYDCTMDILNNTKKSRGMTQKYQLMKMKNQ